jgi:hypothetical protein
MRTILFILAIALYMVSCNGVLPLLNCYFQKENYASKSTFARQAGDIKDAHYWAELAEEEVDHLKEGANFIITFIISNILILIYSIRKRIYKILLLSPLLLAATIMLRLILFGIISSSYD